MNANRDSTQPRSKNELLQELEIWDRTQGRQISKAASDSTIASSVMRKDFDGAAWAVSHDDEFQILIHRARQKVGHGVKSHDTPTEDYQLDEKKATSNQDNQTDKLPSSSSSLPAQE